MRIGLFTDTYPPYINGVSTSIIMLKKSLEQKGHQVFIVTVNDENMKYKYENDNKIIRIPGIPTGIYDYRLTGIYPIRVVNKIKKWNLDVIHSHTEFGVGTFARIIAKQFDIPLVHTYHTNYEDYVHYITKGHFDTASKKIVEYLTLFLCDKTITELIVPTKKTYDLFKSKYKVDRDVHIIPTGIDTLVFHKDNIDQKLLEDKRKEYGIRKDDFVVLFVGRIAKEKNLGFLIDCHSDLVGKYPNLKLLIVGDGPDKEHFEQLVIKNKLENSVIFCGKVPLDSVPIYYNMASVFATASTTETQGLTVIEAMSASNPVLAILDESFANVVIDGYNGYSFKKKQDYKKKLELLLNDSNQLKLLSKQAFTSSEKHSLKHYASSVLEVYKLAIRKKSNKKGLFFKLKGMFGKGK